ncbi:MAG: RNA methyltransferase [Spirochaetia bacterium]|nr:RNA methyltransferase [Spirochaetia bacterium]
MSGKKDPYLIYGRRPALEFFRNMQNSDQIEVIYLSQSAALSLKHEIEGMVPGRLTSSLPRKNIDRMFPGINHQGIVIRMKKGFSAQKNPSFGDWKSLFEHGEGLVVLLDRIQDPFNTGNIIRTAEALGAAGAVITGKGASPGPTVDRASAGASMHLPHFQIQNADQVIEFAKEHHYWVCSSVSEADLDLSVISEKQLHLYTTDLADLPPPEQLLLIIGNEGAGVKNLILKKTDFFITIPLSGETSSLNAGTAAGILMDRMIHR